MAGNVTYEVEGNIAVITIDNPPLNVLNTNVQKLILEGVQKAEADEGIAGSVILGKGGKALSAGADITEFNNLPSEETLPERLQKIENSTKPVAVGVSGLALGGGLELALCAHYRVATNKSLIGLPEVNIGLVPGAGGTQRLPRLIGAEAAIDIICSGGNIPVKKIEGTGLFDLITDGDIRTATIEFLQSKLDAPIRRVSQLTDMIEKDKGNSEMIEKARKNYARRSRGQQSPQSCIDAVVAALELPFDEGMAKERELFRTLVTTDQSKALRHIFFAEREARKIPDVPKDTPTREIKSVAVLGAGTMGGGIAMNFLNVGIPVTIIEHAQDALDRGLAIIRKNYENTAKKGRMTQEDVEKRMSLLTGTLDRKDAADVDLVIEAVFENMDLKREIFGDLDKICKPGAILASNTSTLNIDEMAACTTRPEDFIGLHFFSPANVMPLLEIVRGEKSSKEVIATSMKLAQTIRKIPVLVGVCDGFVGNRMVARYGNQARALLMDGALPEQVDKVLTGFGLAMGPFQMGDLAGLDVGWRIRQEKGIKEPIADALCELGRFGQKTGSGYYLYKEGDRTPYPDPIVKEIIEKASAEQQITRREISDDEILHSTMLSLVNEGAKILEEGFALRASDIDVVYVNGYGFPRYRGGPMQWADSIGLDKALELIRQYNEQYPGEPMWKPSALIEELAEAGSSFAEYDKKKASS